VCACTSASGGRDGSPLRRADRILVRGVQRSHEDAPRRPARPFHRDHARAPPRRYAVRLDAVVAWHRRRPADSLVPSSAGWLKATVTQRTSLFTRRSKRRTLETVVVSDPAVVQGVAQAVNALPLAEPAGPFPSCPLITRPSPFVRLSFRTSALTPARAAVLADPISIASVDYRPLPSHSALGRAIELHAGLWPQLRHRRHVAVIVRPALVINFHILTDLKRCVRKGNLSITRKFEAKTVNYTEKPLVTPHCRPLSGYHRLPWCDHADNDTLPPARLLRRGIPSRLDAAKY
jgi:hypothetical protein